MIVLMLVLAFQAGAYVGSFRSCVAHGFRDFGSGMEWYAPWLSPYFQDRLDWVVAWYRVHVTHRQTTIAMSQLFSIDFSQRVPLLFWGHCFVQCSVNRFSR